MSHPATPTRPPPPMGAILCPRCSSPDTAPYKWPTDPQSRTLELDHPEARICVDCYYVWWNDS